MAQVARSHIPSLSYLLVMRVSGRFVAAGLLCTAAVALAGCSATQKVEESRQGSVEATATPQGHGLAVDVRITPEMRDSKPEPWVLNTPESAVRSYLDWMSYAYRTGDSSAGQETRSGVQQVRIDSYIQYNLQENGRLIDQTLASIRFSKPTIKGDKATIRAREKWMYQHVSATKAGEILSDPKSISYDTKYTLVKTEDGVWVVDAVDPKAK